MGDGKSEAGNRVEALRRRPAPPPLYFSSNTPVLLTSGSLAPWLLSIQNELPGGSKEIVGRSRFLYHIALMRIRLGGKCPIFNATDESEKVHLNYLFAGNCVRLEAANSLTIGRGDCQARYEGSGDQ